MSKQLHGFFLFSLAIMSVLLFSSCTNKTVKDADFKVNQNQQKLERLQRRSVTPAPAVVNYSGYYVNPTPVTLNQSPSWMSQHIVLKAQNMPLNFLVSRILRDTNATVSFQPEVNRNTPVTLFYSGSIKGALNQLAATMNASYEVHGNQVIFAAFVTKTFNISFMPGTTNYQVGQNAGLGAGQAASVANVSGGAGTNNIVNIRGDLGAQQYSNLKGTLSVWDDVAKTVNELRSADGKVYVSESTTSITVTDHPANVHAIGEYIAQLNKALSREVAIQVEVLEVDLNKDFNYGINWNLVQHWIGTQFALAGQLAAGTDIMGAITQGSSANNNLVTFQIGNPTGSNAIINALSQQGKVSLVTQPRVVTLNNQMAEIRITRDTSYLQSVSTTTAVNAGTTTSLTPGIVTDGFSLYLLPKIQGSKIYLQISSSLSTLTAINTVTNAPPGANVNQNNSNSQGQPQFQSIQVPTLAEKLFNQRTAVSSGATLVISGFQQTRDETRRNQLFGVQALGATGAQRTNTQTVLLITPTILKRD